MRMLLLLVLVHALQTNPPALVVSLHDPTGQPLTGVEVHIYDPTGATLLARATTDANGVAPIPPLPSATVRVLVRGRTPQGSELVLPSADARGIAVNLSGPATQLALRSEPDGLVRPDPARMLALEPSGHIPLAPPDQPETLPDQPATWPNQLETLPDQPETLPDSAATLTNLPLSESVYPESGWENQPTSNGVIQGETALAQGPLVAAPTPSADMRVMGLLVALLLGGLGLVVWSLRGGER